MYLAEISPRKLRGAVTLTSVTFSSLGKLSGQFFGLRYALTVNIFEEITVVYQTEGCEIIFRSRHVVVDNKIIYGDKQLRHRPLHDIQHKGQTLKNIQRTATSLMFKR